MSDTHRTSKQPCTHPWCWIIFSEDGNPACTACKTNLLGPSLPPSAPRPPQDAQSPLDAIRRLTAWLDSPCEKGGVWLDWVPESFMDAWGNADVFLDDTSETKSADQLATEDAMNHGSGFIRVMPDGSREHVPHHDVFIEPADERCHETCATHGHLFRPDGKCARCWVSKDRL